MLTYEFIRSLTKRFEHFLKLIYFLLRIKHSWCGGNKVLLLTMKIVETI